MSASPHGRLDSWKEIADYLNRDVRTVIRWEKERRLPVHRIPGGHAVYAERAEIDAWLRGGGSTSGGHLPRDGPAAQSGALWARLTRLSRREPLAISLIFGLVVVGLLAFSLVPPGRSRPHSVAVLPFSNETGAPEFDYLADGMSDGLIKMLSTAPTLKVSARSAVAHFKGREVQPQIVREELGAGAVLVGRLTREHDRLQLALELVDTEDGSVIWGEHYVRSLDEMPSLQQHIAQQLLQALHVRTSAGERTRMAGRYTDDPEAYRAYLQGQHHRYKLTQDGLEKSIPLFEKAIAEDPGFALAYVGLADALALLPTYSSVPPSEALPRAKAAVLHALELDDALAEAHNSMANLYEEYEWDWPRADMHYRRAIELNPNYSVARHWYSHFLARQGKFEEAIAEAQKARGLDPVSVPVSANLAAVLYFAGRYEDAVHRAQETLKLDPAFADAHHVLGMAYLQMKRYDQALAEFRSTAESPQGDIAAEAFLGYLHATAGDRAAAEATLQKLARSRNSRYVSPVLVAMVHASLGDDARAFEYLAVATQQRDPLILYLGVDPAFHRYRGSDKFQQLLAALPVQRR